MTIQNGNADVEQCLSDKKNTLTNERSLLSDEILMGLRRRKEKARSCGSAHNIVTLSRDACEVAERARHSFTAKKHEEETKRKQELKEKGQINKKKKKIRLDYTKYKRSPAN